MSMHLGILLATLISLSSIAKADGEVKIDVKIKPAGAFQAVINKIKGHAYKTEDGVAAENVLVDLRKLDTGIRLRNDHTKKHLDVENYPIAKLVKATGTGGSGKGTIYIKGQNQDVSGTYKINGKNLEAKFKMKLSDLKITGVKYMGVGVADDVIVTVILPMGEAPVAKSSSGKKPKVEDEESEE